MTGVWMYPWQYSNPDLESSLDSLAGTGVDRIKIAAHYHSVRTFDPKADSPGFETFPGGCLFEPSDSRFDRTAIDPPTAKGVGSDDAFGDAVSAATDRGFDVDAWVVCLHGTRLADRYPEYQIEDAFGGSHPHALCPSNPEVREYFAAVVGDVTRYDIERIDLESIGFPSVLHGHGPSFGHHKDQVVSTRAGEFLLSQCFCDTCRREAEGAVDVATAEETISDLCDRYVTRPCASMPTLAELVEEYDVLADLFAFRERVIGTLLSRLATACDGARLGYYLADGGGYAPADLWPSGVTPEVLEEYVDDLTVLCYTGDRQIVDERLVAGADAVTHELDVGLTVDPEVVEGRDHWDRLTEHVTDATDGDVIVYNYNLMTEAHLEWISTLDVQHPV